MKKTFALIIGILLFSAYSYAQETELKPLFNIPNVTVTDLQGNKINTQEFTNDGNPYIISFWATWCKPCIKELTAIADLYEEWQEETGVKLIAVSIDDSRSSAQVNTLINGKGWEYEVLLDVNSDFKRAMNVNAVPHTFIVNKNNEVVWQHTSFSEGSELEMIKVIRQLIEK